MSKSERRQEIIEICEYIKQIWLQYPSLRLGQLLSIVQEDNSVEDIFYIEDSVLKNGLLNVSSEQEKR